MRFRVIPYPGLVIIWLLFSFAGEDRPRVLSFDELEPNLHHNNDTVYLVNFWATWCTPCVEEIPAFERISGDYRDKRVKVLLVSLDFPEMIDKRLVPFLEKHEIGSEVMVLNDPDANSWIDKVHEKWSGAIPATLVYKGDQRDFYEKSLTYSELKTIIEHKL